MKFLLIELKETCQRLKDIVYIFTQWAQNLNFLLFVLLKCFLFFCSNIKIKSLVLFFNCFKVYKFFSSHKMTLNSLLNYDGWHVKFCRHHFFQLYLRTYTGSELGPSPFIRTLFFIVKKQPQALRCLHRVLSMFLKRTSEHNVVEPFRSQRE